MAYVSTSAYGQGLTVERATYKHGDHAEFIRITGTPGVHIHLTPAEAAKLATDLQNALAEPQKVAA